VVLLHVALRPCQCHAMMGMKRCHSMQIVWPVWLVTIAVFAVEVAPAATPAAASVSVGIDKSMAQVDGSRRTGKLIVTTKGGSMILLHSEPSKYSQPRCFVPGEPPLSTTMRCACGKIVDLIWYNINFSQQMVRFYRAYLGRKSRRIWRVRCGRYTVALI
jgi:hypothetical protein